MGVYVEHSLAHIHAHREERQSGGTTKQDSMTILTYDSLHIYPSVQLLYKIAI